MTDLPTFFLIWYGNFNEQKFKVKHFNIMFEHYHIASPLSSSNDRMTRMKLQGQNPAAEKRTHNDCDRPEKKIISHCNCKRCLCLFLSLCVSTCVNYTTLLLLLVNSYVAIDSTWLPTNLLTTTTTTQQPKFNKRTCSQREKEREAESEKEENSLSNRWWRALKLG